MTDTPDIQAAALDAVAAAVNNAQPPFGALPQALSELKFLNQRLMGAVEGLDHHIDALFGLSPALLGELPAQPIPKSFMDALRQEIAQAHNIVGLVDSRIAVFTKSVHG
ncbi:hypothetical protein [Silvimonas sp.]|uniref:hypothetical protein n=1 Tax=Silvimonas sp. TaxID=2650811 RepID=UPI00284CBD75|nr:hypothetical protein [Silvimonas sp.]MDR3427795.1 hypothetical protein [Silvimonas sp.]